MALPSFGHDLVGRGKLGLQTRSVAGVRGSEGRRKFWGWGLEGEGYSRAETEELGRRMAAQLELPDLSIAEPPRVEDLDLREPRIAAPSPLAELFTDEPYERASHSYGKSERDLRRAFRREFPRPIDLVAYPSNEADIVNILAWCSDENVAAIPYGGGSSVVGGVEPPADDTCRGSVSIDLSGLGRVLEIDRTSRSALVEGGIFGPALEQELKAHGLTLRHFPQSFEFSTLGGWIATRSGGHYATLYTHIDEFVQGLRVVAPAGTIETRRLPGSGAGPQPERLFCGSEGALGIITQAWVRLQDKPIFRASSSVRFTSFDDAVAATRAIAQSGLNPANCRLLDHLEALLNGSGDGSHALLVLGVESADHPVDNRLARAGEISLDHRGEEADPAAASVDAGRDRTAGSWREAFLRLPYRHDALISLGLVSGSFETAVTWDQFDKFHAGVLAGIEDAMNEVCGTGIVSCRFAYVYPDGPAPYYTIIAPGKVGSELEQWDAIKAAASDAIIDLGGTITHHHAVGRDHMPWYERERPELFGRVLQETKSVVDPAGILNPGIVVASIDNRRA